MVKATEVEIVEIMSSITEELDGGHNGRSQSANTATNNTANESHTEES